MRNTLLPLSLVVAIGLLAGPAAGATSVELAPPSGLISFDEGAAPPEWAHPLSPISNIARPGSADGKGDSAGDQTDAKCPVIGTAEKRFAEKINRARARRDRRPVSLDLEISAAAAVHSRAMKRQARLYHTGEDALRRRVTRWEVLGENVGRGGDADSLHRAFMASPSHRRTVVDKMFRHVGVAIVRDENQIWMTVLLETKSDPGTRVSMPKGC